MRSITDKNRIFREKLAHIIDSTAAPICIIAPISSWVAAVTLVSYAVGGVMGNSVVGLVLGIVLLSVGVVVLKMRDKSKAKA